MGAGFHHGLVLQRIFLNPVAKPSNFTYEHTFLPTKEKKRKKKKKRVGLMSVVLLPSSAFFTRVLSDRRSVTSAILPFISAVQAGAAGV